MPRFNSKEYNKTKNGKRMRIAVVGVGGVGGYIGAKLCSLIGTQKQSYEIVFIARGKHAEAIKENGILIKEDEMEFRATPSEVCSAEEATGTFDLILVCVKSYDIQEALKPLLKTVRPDTVLIPFANGVTNAQSIANMVDAKVINGCIYILAHIQSEGVIRKEGKVFAAVFGDEEYFGEALHVHYIFKDAGMRAIADENIDQAVWKKYLFIAAFATLTSYYDRSIKSIYEEYYEDAKRLLEEIVSIAKAKSIDIQNEIQKALEIAASLPKDASTSMHLDFQNHHKTELETLSGYIVHEAKQLGVEVPLMAKFYSVLKER